MLSRAPRRLPAHCTYNDWPKVRARYGLRIIGSIHGEHGKTTMIVESIYAGLLIDKEPEMKPKKSYLGQRLAKLYEDVTRHPGKKMRTSLKGGLRIDAISGIDGMFRLQISREKVYPSDSEWETVLNNMPIELAQDIDLERFEHHGCFYIRAGWVI